MAYYNYTKKHIGLDGKNHEASNIKVIGLNKLQIKVIGLNQIANFDTK